MLSGSCELCFGERSASRRWVRMLVLLTVLGYAMLILIAAAMVFLLLGITLKALSWVVRVATRIGSDIQDRPRAGPLEL
jgi:hypothetical protein